jgi:2-oxoisovalerate dehydrogenase E2 component (dihydrolipoyl transacylase)
MEERVFSMPDLGEGLEEGRIVAWLVKEGQEVTLNQPIVEIETAKATVEIPSPFAGSIARLHGAEGEDVRVGAALITFALVGGGGGSAGQSPPNPRSATPATPNQPSRSATPATPAVRKLAKNLGVDLTTISGSGTDGRITSEDVTAAAEGASPEKSEASAQLIALSPTRRAIADNLSKQAAIPQVTTFRTLDCSALQVFRKELGLSPLPVFVAALARTVASHPLINASWQDSHIKINDVVNAAVAVDTERGLMVPVLRYVGARPLSELAAEIARLAGAAREGRLGPDDVADATIGVSNTGTYGSEAGTPLLVPGCSVTIALGVISEWALVVDGAAVPRPACTLSLTFDHRVLDGAAAGRALTDLVRLLSSAEGLGDLPR